MPSSEDKRSRPFVSVPKYKDSNLFDPGNGLHINPTFNYQSQRIGASQNPSGQRTASRSMLIHLEKDGGLVGLPLPVLSKRKTITWLL